MTETNQFLLCIPPEKLPECWKDESRINVLFAPFRSRNANPQDWDSKLAFWRKMIGLYCEHSKTYSFTIHELLKVFNKNGRSPGCLEEVLDEMFKLKEIKPLNDYLEMPSRSWVDWAAQVFVKKPIIWTFNTVKNSLVEPDKNVEFVHLPSIENAEKELLNNLPEELEGKVIHLKTLIEAVNFPPEKINSFQLILHRLVCDGKADLKLLSTIKDSKENFLQSNLVKVENSKKLKPISDTDISIHKLEENEKFLLKNIEKQETDISNLREEAKQYLQKGHRHLAKSILVKKKELEKQLNKKVSALHNVQILLSKVKDVESDANVLSSYKLALSTLKDTFEQTGLTEDAVAETMISLGDVLDIHEDVQSSLAQSVREEDTEELEQELADLVAAEKQNEKEVSPKKDDNEILDLEKKLQHLILPDVPTTGSSQSRNKISL